MRIFQQGEIDVSKPNIFIDVDDVILNSSDTVIDILNRKFNLHKTKKDLKDWGFKSITHECNRQMLEDIFCSKEFWNNVTCKTELIEALENNCDNENSLLNSYNWILTTKGDEENHNLKYNYIFNSNNIPFFAEHKNKFSYYALYHGERKDIVNMYGGIQIDDNYNNLKTTDASVKILLKNGIGTNYNDYYLTSDNLQNLYIVDNVEEVVQILDFISVNERQGYEQNLDFNFIDNLDDFEIE